MSISSVIRLFKSERRYRRRGLPRSEAWFLARAARSGCDWETSLSQVRARYGVSRPYKDWLEEIVLPPTTAISASPIGFHLQNNAGLENYPVHYCSVYISDQATFSENFDGTVDAVTKVLGPGERSDVSNCWTMIWKFGVFNVKLYAWPPDEEQFTHNRLYNSNPILKQSAQLLMSSDIVHVFPDSSLLDLPRSKGYRQSIVSNAKGISSLDRSVPLLVRRNPPALIDEMPEKAFVFWGNTRAVGISERNFSVQFERSSIRALQYWRLMPARGTGGSTINVVLHGMPAGREQMTLAHGATLDALQDTGERLSETWDTPLDFCEGYDD